MDSRNEELLNALLNDETVDMIPQSRAEAYLKACCEKCGCSGLPTPISRNDVLLYALAEKLKGGNYTNLLNRECVLLNERVSSSSEEIVSADGYVTIKNIPITGETVNIRFRGLRYRDDGYLIFSNAEDEFQHFEYSPTFSLDENGDTMISATNNGYSFCHITLSWFFSSSPITSEDIKNSIVTVNEKIG